MRWQKAKSGFGLVAALLASRLTAGVPNVISYEGVLLDPRGLPLIAPASVRFRIFKGGDGTSLPSTGVLAYDEVATVSPVDGVFSHLIGTGAAANDCETIPCVLDENVFSPGDTPVWIEVTLDPDGVPDTGDEDTMLPRTRVGTVGYAYRVATLDGAIGGNMTGTLVADQLVGRAGVVLGTGADADLTLISVDQGTGTDPTLGWEDAAERFNITGANLAFDDPATTSTRGIEWSVASPVATKLYSGMCSTDFHGNRDNIMAWSYNRNCNGARIDASEHAFQVQMETSYDYSATAGRQDKVEINWDYTTPGGTQWRPFTFGVDVPSGKADWAFKPNNLNGGNNYSLQIDFPNVMLNRDAGSDNSRGNGLSSYARSANFPSGDGTTATLSAVFIDHTDWRPYNFTGTDSTVDFSSTGAAASVFDVRAGWFHATLSGTTPGRFANRLDGIRVDVNAIAVSPGARDIVNGSAAYRAHFDFSGTNITFGETRGFHLDTPSAPGALMYIPGHTGVRIDDQRYDRPAMRGGSTIYIAPQSVSDATEGNVVVAGTGYNHGHYQIGATHFWEESPGMVALKAGPPASDADGARLVTSARSPTSGPAAWAADGVSCEAACTNIGQANCADSVSLYGGRGEPGSCTGIAGTRMCECY